jgi:HK97 family phage major capsid protein
MAAAHLHDGSNSPAPIRAAGHDTDGRPVFALSNRQRMVDLPRAKDEPSAEGVSLGRMLCSMISGDWRNSPREQEYRAALSTTSDPSGGFMVPSELSRQLIDRARAQSIVMQAGAMTVPMSSDELTMARVLSDPSFAVTAENVALTESNPTFDAISFHAYKIGVLVKVSRELVDDASNLPAQLEDVLSKAFAAELDRLALVGSGSAEPLGLENIVSLPATGSVGAILWTDIHSSATTVRVANHTPNAYLVHPSNAGALDILTSGDGSNSAALWQGPPPSLDGIARHVSTNVTTALGFTGDFTKMAIAVRQDPKIELSSEAGSAFENHQVFLKLTWRGDVGVLDKSAFHKLHGITV